MEEERFETTKQAVLSHIQTLFDRMEEETVISHQEKYALLEDAFDQASDVDELRVAFEQWYSEHADELGLDINAEELWVHATGEEHGEYASEDDDEKLNEAFVQPPDEGEEEIF